MSSDRVLQALNLEKQDLRSALDEQMDKVAMANERVKKAEAFANDYQVELSKIRAENSELDRLNVSVDNIILTFLTHLRLQASLEKGSCLI